MTKYKHKGISFANDRIWSLADFKKEFDQTPAFKVIPHKQRDKELKRVCELVNKHNKKNEFPSSTKKSKSDKDEPSKE